MEGAMDLLEWIVDLPDWVRPRYIVLMVTILGSLISAAIISKSSKKAFRVIGLLFYAALLVSVFYILYMVIRRECVGY